METVRWIALFLGLGINSISDLKSKRIILSVTALIGALGLIWQLVQPTRDYFDFLSGIVIGIIVIVISKITNGAVGYGDGLVLVMCGIWLGNKNNLLLCSIGIILAGIWAIILIVFFRKKKDYEIPFVPFLFLGLVWMRCIS